MRSFERGLWMAAVVGVALLAGSRGTRAGKGSDIEDRLTHLEVQFGKLKDTVREDSLRLTTMTQRQDDLDARMETVIPSTTRWLRLSPGGTLRWEPKVGGQVYVQFVRMDADGRTPVIHFNVDPGGEFEAPVRAGEVMELVDDRGTEKLVFRLTLLRVIVDENGPSQAMFALTGEKVT